MKYIPKSVRQEIASFLRNNIKEGVRYRNRQPPHPRTGINIRRAIAEMRIGRLQKLVGLLDPTKTDRS